VCHILYPLLASEALWGAAASLFDVFDRFSDYRDTDSKA
jgi:hypothetical protein